MSEVIAFKDRISEAREGKGIKKNTYRVDEKAIEALNMLRYNIKLFFGFNVFIKIIT